MAASPSSPKTVADLVRATGLCRETVTAAILTGELPGYRVGSRYVIPADAFEDFCHGRWVRDPRPVFSEPIKPITAIRRTERRAS